MTLSTAAALATLLSGYQILGAQTSQSAEAHFEDLLVIDGLELPTAVGFGADGRLFVAEKSGIVTTVDQLGGTAAVFADLRTQVHNYWDRGLLGLAVHPDFPATPSIYVLYAHDAPAGGRAPTYGTVGGTSDGCPTPTTGCVVSGRLSRLDMGPDGRWDGTEHVLIEDWFQRFGSHSVGSLTFGPDGALYASAGEGASWTVADRGQNEDPPVNDSGALRAQDLRTSGDPLGLSGTVIRIDPRTGDGWPGNPLAADPDPNARRIVASGLRNPFRITTRPGTPEVWIGDVGWRDFEELDVIPDAAALAAPLNFGWPCYEGPSRQPGYDAADAPICEDLYTEEPAAMAPPYFVYRQGTSFVTGDGCGSGDASLSGLAFYPGGAYPAEYDGALFVADYSRGCIWVMRAGADGRPDAATRRTFAAGVAAVDLRIGPGGDLYYVDIAAGAVHRITYRGDGASDADTDGDAGPATAPVPAIDAPAASLRWQVGQAIAFAGRATAADGSPLPDSALTWALIMNHCSPATTSCHQHFVQEYAGVASGTFTAPDHEYPSYLTLRLRASAEDGSTGMVERRLDPQTTTLSFETQPAGLRVVVGSESIVTPATRTVIAGTRVTVAAPTPQTQGGVPLIFAGWSDGGAATHTVVSGVEPATYRALFTAAALTVPEGWTSEDVGAVGVAGSAAESGGTFTVRGGGADVWGTADAFHFAYRTLAGDGTIVARVATNDGVQPWTKIGVMFRATTAPESPHAFMLVSTGKGLAFQRRTKAGGDSYHTAGPAGTAPRWVRLTRRGNLVTAAASIDGVAWVTVGSATVALPAASLVDLAVLGRSTTTLATATFDHVSITSEAVTPALPAGWQGSDIGAVGRAGSASESGGVYTVTGAGADVWGTADAFHFTSRPLAGDGEIVARVAMLSGTQDWTKVGVMIRQSLAADAPHAFMLVSKGKGLAFQRRATAGGVSVHTAVGGGTAPRWLRLVRAGAVITASVSTDGVSWTVAGSDTLAIGGAVQIGLAVSSHTTSATATGTFSNVTVTP